MNDQQLDEIRHWIATDQSDFAQCCREAIAPSIAELAQKVRQFKACAPKPEQWVIMMRPAVYSLMLPVRRRKLQPYIRKAWREAM